jgi:heme exporter protein A
MPSRSSTQRLAGTARNDRSERSLPEVLISARGLEKRYGAKRALRAVDIELVRGSFLLVTGPNGSGKTTLLRLIAGLAAPSKGELDVKVERRQLGFLGHEALLYRDLTATENLDLYGRLYRVAERPERIRALLDRFGLWQVRSERAGSLSRGMLQRLALCRTLLHDPALLVLDEPFTALDAEGSILLDGQLLEMAGTRTVVMTTHDPQRAEPLATHRLELA